MVHLVLGRGTSSSHIFAVELKEPSLQKGKLPHSDSLHDPHDIHLSSPIIVQYGKEPIQ